MTTTVTVQTGGKAAEIVVTETVKEEPNRSVATGVRQEVAAGETRTVHISGTQSVEITELESRADG